MDSIYPWLRSANINRKMRKLYLMAINIFESTVDGTVAFDSISS